MKVTILKSKVDKSVNFIHEADDRSLFESRYVNRGDGHATCYLSCQAGCKQGCKMCWLTKTGQTADRDATLLEIVAQAIPVLELAQQNRDQLVYFSFMARGEPLASKTFQSSFDLIAAKLEYKAGDYGLLSRFNFSTIMPRSFNQSLFKLFPTSQPIIYYSLYSTDDSFRQKWLPSAMPVSRALKLLRDYQLATDRIVKIHYPLINNLNDSSYEADKIASTIRAHNLRVDINLIAYNGGEESDNYAEYKVTLEQGLPEARVRIVDRVGLDVYASCGMFAERGSNG